MEEGLMSGLVRVRESYLRDRAAPLLSGGGSGAVKLDLALRVLATETRTASPPGLIDDEIAWEGLHDLVRPAAYYADEVTLKRNWVSDKLRVLEREGLISRERRPGKRSRLWVLRDDGSGQPFDDPVTLPGESYVTFLGAAVTSRRIATWGAGELSAFMAAMIGERYARADPALDHLTRRLPLGGGVWSHSLSWFADPAQQRPATHVRIPFSVRTLRRGFTSLEGDGLVAVRWISRDPRTGHKYANGRPRRLYVNGFDALDRSNPTAATRCRRILQSIAVRGHDLVNRPSYSELTTDAVLHDQPI